MVKRSIALFAAVCGLWAVLSCTRATVSTAAPEEAAPPQEARTPEAPTQAPATISTTFDLGGPCHEPPPYRPLALTGKDEDELRNAKNWDALIEAAKQNVRNFCSNPYLWQQLFEALVDGHRYNEALQAMGEMRTRQFPLPSAFLSRVDPAFLNSELFKNSKAGAEYAATNAELNDRVRGAEQKLSSMSKHDLPPSIYRNVGACPFECCTYRQWKTKTAVQLRESIESSNIVAEIPAGVSVLGVTGEVRVEPEPYVVLEDVGRLKTGDIIFFLDNRGEGYVNYWYEGKLNPELGLDEGLWLYTDNECSASRSKGACSLRKLKPGRKFRNEWWVRIKPSNGKEGWVLNTGQFDNMDACG